MKNEAPLTAEGIRLSEDRTRLKNWKRWRPYLSERQWATVREDYSPYGNCWDYFPHDHARSRVYRWGEDGLLGFTDRECRLCFALAVWNGRAGFYRSGSAFNPSCWNYPRAGLLFRDAPRARPRCGSPRPLETRIRIEHRARNSESQKRKVDASGHIKSGPTPPGLGPALDLGGPFRQFNRSDPADRNSVKSKISYAIRSIAFCA
jgi:hypothetical protein